MEPGTAYISVRALESASTPGGTGGSGKPARGSGGGGDGGGDGGGSGAAPRDGAAFWLDVLRVLLVPLRTPALIVARGNLTRGCGRGGRAGAGSRRAPGSRLAAGEGGAGARGAAQWGLPQPAACGSSLSSFAH
jgi:hypothetical protein